MGTPRPHHDMGRPLPSSELSACHRRFRASTRLSADAGGMFSIRRTENSTQDGVEARDPTEPEDWRKSQFVFYPLGQFRGRRRVGAMAFHVSLTGRKDLSGEIYRQIRRAIVAGRLRPGDTLPASRELARGLAVSRMTVTVAYDRLAGEGFVSSRRGAGTFVSEGVGNARREPAGDGRGGVIRPRPIFDTIGLPGAFNRPARFDFRTGLPDASLFPHRTWRRLIARALRSSEMSTGVYGHAAGQRDLRAAIARHIGVSRGVEASADDIVITNGTQQALD